MTGFIRGLFGGSKEKRPPQEPKVSQPRQGAFFLDSDEAKTYGNLDYMRTAKTIRRTFPKSTLGTVLKDQEQTKQISADQSRNVAEQFSTSQSSSSSGFQTTSGAGTQQSSAQNSQTKIERRRPKDSSSMDTFRNMARDMRKKKK